MDSRLHYHHSDSSSIQTRCSQMPRQRMCSNSNATSCTTRAQYGHTATCVLLYALLEAVRMIKPTRYLLVFYVAVPAGSLVTSSLHVTSSHLFSWSCFRAPQNCLALAVLLPVAHTFGWLDHHDGRFAGGLKRLQLALGASVMLRATLSVAAATSSIRKPLDTWQPLQVELDVVLIVISAGHKRPTSIVSSTWYAQVGLPLELVLKPPWVLA